MAESYRRPLLLSLPILVFLVFAAACGKKTEEGSYRYHVRWQLAGGSVVSRDGRYAYYITYKDIGPYQTMGRSWQSPHRIGRFDVMTGQFDSWPIPAGYTLIDYGGLTISETVSNLLWSDTGLGSHSGQSQIHGYGDGRFVCYVRTTNIRPDVYFGILIDNERDTYWQFDKNVREGYISTDERYVVYWKRDSADTWLYDIAAARKRKIGAGEALPVIIRDHSELREPEGRVGRWHEFIQKYIEWQLYILYPEQEEIK